MELQLAAMLTLRTETQPFARAASAPNCSSHHWKTVLNSCLLAMLWGFVQFGFSQKALYVVHIVH